jgi:hypothetical protein
MRTTDCGRHLPAVLAVVLALAVGCRPDRASEQERLALDRERAYLADVLQMPIQSLEPGSASSSPVGPMQRWYIHRPDLRQQSLLVVTFGSRLGYYWPGGTGSGYFRATPGYRSPRGPMSPARAVRDARGLAYRAWLFDHPETPVVARVLKQDKEFLTIELAFASDAPSLPEGAQVVFERTRGLCTSVQTLWPEPADGGRAGTSGSRN